MVTGHDRGMEPMGVNVSTGHDTSWQKKRRVRSILFGVAAIIISLGLFCLWADTQSASPDSDPKEIHYLRLGLALQPSSALAIIAQEKGFFAAQGLNVSVKEYPSGKRALHEGLFQGEVDLITTTEVPVVIASLNRTDLCIIASLFSANNVNRIVARKDSGIHGAWLS